MSDNTTNETPNDLREETAEAAPEVAVQDRVGELENQLAEAKQHLVAVLQGKMGGGSKS